MRSIFSLLLFCLILENVLSFKRALKMKMYKAIKKMKSISESREKMRKLDGTDASGDESGDSDTTVQTTPAAEKYVETPPNESENGGSATAENAMVPASKPVATKPKLTDKKNAPFQVNKFHGFKIKSGEKKVTFGAFFYFFGRPIVKFIIMRLRITYNSRLRNLQTGEAESARTDCSIVDETMLGKVLDKEEGANVNYNCEATGSGDLSKANFTLNTDVPITLVNANGTTESMSFDDVNFNGDSSKASASLQENTQTVEFYTFKVLEIFFEKYILVMNGELSVAKRLLRYLTINDGDTIPLNIKAEENGKNVAKQYDCIISGTKATTTELRCDTSKDPLKTTLGDMDMSFGTVGNDGFQIDMKEFIKGNSTDFEIETPSGSGNSRYTYVKSSSGLSGGAIAGIVIACVVALAAASIAAIMLRKPTPPVENTTIVDLKTDNI